jgi:hypothetical protein
VFIDGDDDWMLNVTVPDNQFTHGTGFSKPSSRRSGEIQPLEM